MPCTDGLASWVSATGRNSRGACRAFRPAGRAYRRNRTPSRCALLPTRRTVAASGHERQASHAMQVPSPAGYLGHDDRGLESRARTFFHRAGSTALGHDDRGLESRARTFFHRAGSTASAHGLRIFHCAVRSLKSEFRWRRKGTVMRSECA